MHRGYRYELKPSRAQASRLLAWAGATRSGIYRIRLDRPGGGCYVGSALRLRHRVQTHISHLNCGRHHSKRLQAAWSKYGPEAFVFEILEEVEDPTKLLAREQHWIDTLNAFVGRGGFNMLPTAGSPLGRKHSAETRAKQSAAHRGRKFTEEHLRNMSEAQHGRPQDPDSVRRGAEKRRGRSRDPEASAKAAAKNRGQKRSAEAKARMSEWQKGKPASEALVAHLQGLAAANRGRRHSPETIEKIRAARIGKRPDAEVRARMSAAQRRRYGSD
jgi:group I intron endonuclease